MLTCLPLKIYNLKKVMLLIKSSLYIYVDCHGIVIKFWAKQDDSNANLKPNTTKVFELVKIVIVSDP